ncbi:MAG: hypothetical protein ACRDI2_04800 [Chloroflexota bacterium]
MAVAAGTATSNPLVSPLASAGTALAFEDFLARWWDADEDA